jgi:hypothetical protein
MKLTPIYPSHKQLFDSFDSRTVSNINPEKFTFMLRWQTCLFHSFDIRIY